MAPCSAAKVTAQDVADQLVARLKVKRDQLAAMPEIASLCSQRDRLEGVVDGLSQALAMVRRIG